PRGHHREQKFHPVRSSPPHEGRRHSPGQPFRHHAWHEGTGDGSDRSLGRGNSQPHWRRRGRTKSPQTSSGAGREVSDLRIPCDWRSSPRPRLVRICPARPRSSWSAAACRRFYNFNPTHQASGAPGSIFYLGLAFLWLHHKPMNMRVPHPSRLLRRVGSYAPTPHSSSSSLLGSPFVAQGDSASPAAFLLGFSCLCTGRFLKRPPSHYPPQISTFLVRIPLPQ